MHNNTLKNTLKSKYFNFKQYLFQSSRLKSSSTLKQSDPLGDLIIAIIGPFLGFVLLMVSPFFISNHENQCGRVKLFNDCWLSSYVPQKGDGELFKECYDGYFIAHTDRPSGCKLYELNDAYIENCASIRRTTWIYTNNEWILSKEHFNNELESYYKHQFPKFCNYAVTGNIGKLKLTAHQIQYLSDYIIESKDANSLLKPHINDFKEVYGNNLIINNNEVYCLSDSSSLNNYNEGDARLVYEFRLFKSNDEIHTFGLKYYDHIIPFYYYDYFKLPPVYTSFNTTYNLSSYLKEADINASNNKDYVDNMPKANKLGLDQPDYSAREFSKIFECCRDYNSIDKTLNVIDSAMNEKMFEKMYASRALIIVVFCVLPHILAAAPLFYIFKALWIIGFIPGLLMFVFCLTASMGWYMMISGFVYIPYSVISSTLCTIFGMALYAGSLVLSYLMVNGLVNGAVSVWQAITGSK